MKRLDNACVGMLPVDTTGDDVVIVETARRSSSVSEFAIAWGPSLVDEDVVARMDAVRALGYQPLPGQPSLNATA